MSDKDKLKIVNLAEYRNEKDDHFKKGIKAVLDDLMKAIEEDRLKDIVLQWEEKEPTAEEGVDSTSVVIYWNPEQDLDKSLGCAHRLAHRIFLISEGLIEV